MVLNERKIRILEAIINDYINTAEPIGSRTIAKKYNMGISSATIRNEMSDLEEMGLIVQPHASAGRVPSDKGYRLYVDNLMPKHDITPAEAAFLHQMIINNINHIDFLMKEIAKAISVLTRYATIVSEPKFYKTTIKHVQLVPIDERSIVLVLVTDSNVVRNQVISLADAPDYEQLQRLTSLLNDRLKGLCSADIGDALFTDIIHNAPEADRAAVSVILSTIMSAIENEDGRQVYAGGVKNILAFPEFSDVDKARKLFHALEEREMLITLLNSGDESDKIQVVIGSENTVDEMKDCSLVKASYRFGGRNYGSIGVIGPTRMNYVQAMSILSGVVKNINKALGELSGG
ncbi:MAG: heat-inducible transcriptional repressor HrcA [Defluviitaleaceae bacterium]|nr:heat-inducible transcriptional repressor HrcA [Defluviitaleaceae bacterium]